MSCALRPVSLVLLLGAAFPIALRAQQSPVEITPIAGLYVPTTTVVSQFEPLCSCDVSLKQKPAFLVGTRVLFWMNRRLGVEAALAYSGSGVQAEASGLGTADTSAEVILGTARLVARLNRPDAATGFLAGVGFGVVSHGGDAYNGATGTTDLGASVMFGVRSEIGAHLAVRLEVEDYLYSASFGPSPNTDSKFQHDLVVSLGLGIALGR